MSFRITAITDWYEDEVEKDGDASHIGYQEANRIYSEEYDQKIENDNWPDIPCEYDIDECLERQELDGLAPEDLVSRVLVDKYNEDHDDAYIKAADCEWEEVVPRA